MKKWYVLGIGTLIALLGMGPSRAAADNIDTHTYYAADYATAAYTNMHAAYLKTLSKTVTFTFRGRRPVRITTLTSSYPNTQYAADNFAIAVYYADLARAYIEAGDYATAQALESYVYFYTFAGYAYTVDVETNGPSDVRHFAILAAGEAKYALLYSYLAANTSYR